MPTALVTGGTGMVGSGLVQKLRAKGYQVKCMVRPSSDTTLLESMGVELFHGDLLDPIDQLIPHFQNVDYVFHCAAFVHDWAPLEEMMRANVTGLDNLIQASKQNKQLKRFVFIGSMAVLGMDTQDNLDESAPWKFSGDNYNYSKIKAEQLALKYAKEENFPIVVLRPPYIYGPRDRQFFPRVVENISNGIFKYVGDGERPFTLVYSENLVQALILAAETAGVEGQLYMITDGESITRKDLIELLCGHLNLEKPKGHIPYGVALVACRVLEVIAKITKQKNPPIINKFRLKFLYTHLTYNIEKAKRELGYKPIPTQKGLIETINWYKKDNAGQKQDKQQLSVT